LWPRQWSPTSRHELRDVLPVGNDNLDLVIGSGAGGVVLLQPLSKMMSVYANYGILLRVELGIPAEGIESDAIFRNLTGQPIELLVAQVPEQARKLRRTP
jgi:hypothetical protein